MDSSRVFMMYIVEFLFLINVYCETCECNGELHWCTGVNISGERGQG